MFSKFLRKSLLSIASLSPVFLTFWFNEFSKNWDLREGYFYLIGFVIIVFISFFTFRLAESKLEILPIKIETVQNSDNEVISYIFAYILPLLGFDVKLTLFILCLFLLIVFTTNIYHFNPVVGLFGYHYYTVTIEGGISFILISKKTLMNAKEIKNVVQLDDYTLLERR